MLDNGALATNHKQKKKEANKATIYLETPAIHFSAVLQNRYSGPQNPN